MSSGVIARAIERCDWFIELHERFGAEEYAAGNVARWAEMTGKATAAMNIKRILEGHDGD